MVGESLTIMRTSSASSLACSRSSYVRLICSNIASSFAEATPDKLAVLIATGLVLFMFTFAVNFAARAIVARTERKFER